jgi:hypothetical protein
MSQGSLLIFLHSPISAVITLAALTHIALPVLGPLVRRLRAFPRPAVPTAPR